MTRICHLFDGSTGWEHRVGVWQLMNRLPRDRFSHDLAAIDPVAVAALRSVKPRVRTIARLPQFVPLAACGVALLVARGRFDLIHAWGPKAAAAARAASRLPVVMELFDPVLATRHVKMIRALARPRGFAAICSCDTVRRRLVEGGVPPEVCVLIRPGVDFGLINRWRQGALRERLGLADGDYMVTVPASTTVSEGQFDAYAAAAMMNYLDGGVRMIVAGDTPQRRRIRRFADALIGQPALVETDECVPFEELISVSDALVITARGDVPTTSIAWAMAAGTAVIGSAVPAVTELIADRHNGLLFKPIPGKSMAGPVFRLLNDRASQAKAKEVARGQAYGAFSIRRRVDQHVQLYQNVRRAMRPHEEEVGRQRTTDR